MSIGEAARRVGLAPSAIRFYEAEGLLDAPRGDDGRRRYGPAELRTLAFVAMARDLGLGLAAIRDALHPGPDGWAAVVDAQVALLDAQIARARRAREVLLSGRDCPAPQPVRDCPYLRDALDALVAGSPLPGAGHRGGAATGNAATGGDG
ncbi:MerR family transcriptional regulator [Pseudonocardia kunmingensis]|uniref:MerR family transcriptional regulator n=1 Tax=Pseudonocardia kunmingensis TaxID=630975 RepID=A0A543DYQ9_9PSEU|nr:MerR family transcriptional regulator [Pseudonocardia kunmingensis]TQM14463.1 MerR family transcriptional regulator [Pseudonocardia kunmingensis]